MKLRQIDYAVRLARTLSFRKAAAEAGATQPTLSNGLAQLEEELGGRLFDRTTRDVSLTPFGRHMLPFLETLLGDADEIGKAAAAWHDPAHKILRIGMSPLIDLKTIERALGPYRQAHPDVSILFKECLLDDLIGRLQTGKLDFGLRVTEPVPEGMQALPAYRDPLFYLPRETQGSDHSLHPWQIGALPDAPIICTNGACGLNAALKRLFEAADAGLTVYPGYALSYHVIEEWTELGVGAAILPATKLSPANMTAGPLQGQNGEPLEFSYEWVTKSARLASTPAHVKAFRQHIETVAPALLKG